MYVHPSICSQAHPVADDTAYRVEGRQSPGTPDVYDTLQGLMYQSAVPVPARGRDPATAVIDRRIEAWPGRVGCSPHALWSDARSVVKHRIA